MMVVELKEVNIGNQVRAVYKVQVQRNQKFLGFLVQEFRFKHGFVVKPVKQSKLINPGVGF